MTNELKAFLPARAMDSERFEEIESYLRIETDENVARGLPYDDARAAAVNMGLRASMRRL